MALFIYWLIASIIFLAIRYILLNRILLNIEPLAYKGEMNYSDNNPVLWTINYCGIMLLGHFREYYSYYIAYQFITFAHIPLIPIGCYVVSDTSVYGSTKWNILEVLSVYFQYFGWIGLVASSIYLLCGLFI